MAPAAAPAAPLPARTGAFHHGLVGRLRTYFLTGLILVAPAYITISLTWWFINWVDDLVRPFIPIAYQPETYLPVKIPGTGLIIAFVTLTLFGFLTANFVGRKLQQLEADLSDAVCKRRLELPARRSHRISLARNVVAGISFESCESRDCNAFAGHRACCGFHAVYAQSDHRLLLLRSAPRHHRSRHHGGGGDDVANVGRNGAARRSATQARGIGRDRTCGARRAGQPCHRSGKIACISIVNRLSPSADEPDRLIALEQIEQVTHCLAAR